LIYPYIRNYDFVCDTILGDVLKILSGGKRVILRCLLEINAIFDSSEFHYLFNKLYINHYICWVQLVGDELVESFSNEVKQYISREERDTTGNYIIEKESLDLNLELIEQQAFNEVEDSNGHIASSESESSADSNGDDDSTSDDESSSDGEDDSAYDNGDKDELQVSKAIVREEVQNMPTKKPSLLDDKISLDQSNGKKIGHLLRIEEDSHPSPPSIERSQQEERLKKSLITEISD